MLTFADLHIALRGGYLTLIFILLCVSVCLFPLVLRRSSLWPKWILPLCVLLNSGMILLYGTNMKASREEMVEWELSRQFWELPLWITLLPVLAMAVYLGFVTWKTWQYRSNTLTRSSIKESLDQITTGLCFSQGNGRIILANHRMHALCHTLAGRDLQNAEAFWKILSGGEVQAEVERLSSGSHPHFRLPDGSVWTFSRQEIEDVVQLTAADTTQLQQLTEELREQNIQLASMNLRLQQYGENVDELTRSRERLEIKARLHSDLGQALVATRRYLQDEDGVIESPVDLWKQNFAVLRAQVETKETKDPLEMMQKAAAGAGVRVEISGARPEQPQIDKLFCQAALETLTNAVRHAEATVLRVELTEGEDTCTACYSNNGRLPEGELVEGGGLGSLRRKVENQGGSMTITCAPEFALTITVPKNWSDIP